MIIQRGRGTLLERHLFAQEPKHVLALDGGGVRGILSLAFLERAERLLSEHYGTGADFRLSDHFALIGGTSTGSIIATGLALGYPVEALIHLYCTLSSEAFARPRWLGRLLQAKFPTEPLMAAIQSQIGNRTLGSSDLRTGLALVAKRLDTDSVWLFHNHPNGLYFAPDGTGSQGFTPNRDLQLAELIRASTAAPTYFEPEYIEVAPGVAGTFVDGGVSPHNNPSLALFMLATMRGYGFRWPTGPDRLHIVSVGTGRTNVPPKVTARTTAAGLGLACVTSMMNDSGQLVERMMQWMGAARNPEPLDSEVGDLANEFAAGAPLFGYARYNIPLEQAWLTNELGYDPGSKLVRKLIAIDEPDVVDELLTIGRELAARKVELRHLLASGDSDNS